VPWLCFPWYVLPIPNIRRLVWKPVIRFLSAFLEYIALLVRAPCQSFAPSARHHNRENCNSFAHSCINWKLVRSHEGGANNRGSLLTSQNRTLCCKQEPVPSHLTLQRRSVDHSCLCNMVYEYSMLICTCKAETASEARGTLRMSSLLHHREKDGNGYHRKLSFGQRLSSEKSTLKRK
jgi:hypothetical protein